MWQTKMFQICKFKNSKDKKCPFCGVNGQGQLFCGIAKTGVKGNHIQTNVIGRMDKCPRKKKH